MDLRVGNPITVSAGLPAASSCEHYLERVKRLPPTPTLVVELLALFREPDRDVDRVVEVISHCPSLTAEILRRCNSAALSGDHQIEDMFEAVSRVGFYEIYTIVVAMLGSSAMAVPDAGRGIDLDALWQHSVLTAVAGGNLARHLGESEGAGFTAGLLHDLGKLVLAAVEQERYAEVCARAGGSGLGLVAAENARFGVDHAILGAQLLQRWSLPAYVVDAVRCHHQPQAADHHPRLAAAAFLANDIAKGIAEDRAPTQVGVDLAGETEQVLTFSAEEVAEFYEQTRVAFERVRDRMARH